jgi:hypothetical protein
VRRRKPLFVVALAVALFPLLPLAAVAAVDEPEVAAQPAETPEEAIRKTLEAMRAHDFQALAKRAHPAAFAELRQRFRPLVVADSRHEITKLFFGVESLAAFDALSDQALFVALMTQLTNLGGGPSSDARFTLLGSVAEPPDLAHVVYRAAFTGDAGGAASTVNLMSVRKDQGEWKAILTENLNAMTEKIFALLQSAVVKE